jgi:hypothetical protein
MESDESQAKFRRNYHLQFQDLCLLCLLPAWCWFLAWFTPSTMKMDATCSSETSVYFNWAKASYIPEARTLQPVAVARAVWGVNSLLSLGGRDCVFESRLGHGCLMCVRVFLCLCCPVFRKRPCDELITRPRSPTACEKDQGNWVISPVLQYGRQLPSMGARGEKKITLQKSHYFQLACSATTYCSLLQFRPCAIFYLTEVNIMCFRKVKR